MTVRYRVRRISALSLTRFGCLLGAAVLLLPAALCSAGLVWLVGRARLWLDGLQEGTVELLGTQVDLNLVEVLGLGPLVSSLAAMEEQGPALVLALALLGAIFGGLLLALSALLVAWGYNLLAWLSGGLEVDLAPETPGGDDTGF
ncbi:MAG: DUF3566 domain-containing protein [Anaerolineae bacterium]